MDINQNLIKMDFKIAALFVSITFSFFSCFGQLSKPIEQEIPPAASIDCFPGAYYRKAVTSFDEWTGISGVVILGYPKFDENRLNTKTGQPLDNFSVYMGGNAADHEVDAGLTWEFSTDAAGKLSPRRNSWRPFWRAGNWNSAPNQPQFIWKPGDKVRMSVRLAGQEKLRMIIEDLDHPEKRFEVVFDAPGFTAGVLRQFKRVNAIDQSHNEGKPVQPTSAQVTGAKWVNTVLFRGAEHQQLPMNKSRFTDMRCSDASHIVVTPVNEATGAEKIDIFGTPPLKNRKPHK
jgi:hypothetical protein